MRPIWDSIRGRLILLVGLGLLPTLGLLLFISLQARASVDRGVETNARSTRQLVAVGQENLVAGVRLVLSTLAETGRVRAGGAGCHDLLAAVLDLSVSFSDLWVTDAEGQVLCSARETGQPASVAGKPWLALVLSTRDFAVGEYELSPATGEPVIFFAAPVLDELDELIGVVAGEVPLTRLAEVPAGGNIPPTADIIVFDRRGTVLTRFPVAEGMVGQQLGDSPLAQAVLTNENTARELPGPDGDVRLYAYRPLGQNATLGLYLAVGFSRQLALANFDAQLALYAGVILALTLLNLGLAYVAGIQLVLRPVEALARGFRRLRQGDLAARVAMGDSRTDFGALGQDFNATAEALQTRDAERQAAEVWLRQSEERYRTLFTQSGMCAAVFDDEGRIVEANDACAEMLGYPLEAMVGLSLWEITPLADRAGSQASWGTWRQTRYRKDAYIFQRKDGGLAYVDYNAAANVMPGHHLWMMRDVSERRRAELENHVLADIGRALEASLEPKARLRGVLNALVPAMADWCVAHLTGPEGKPVLEGVAHADPAQAAQLEEAAQRHALDATPAAEPAQVFATAKLAFIPNLAPAPDGETPVWPLLREMGAYSLIIIPLVARGRTLGVLTLARTQASRSYIQDDVMLMGAVGRRCALALDNARLFEETQVLNLQLEQRVAERTEQLRRSLEEVQASHEALRSLSRQLQSARETERRHIAREIHDELGGALTGLKMDIVGLRGRLSSDRDISALTAKADGMATLIDTTIQTVRRLASELHPSQLDDLGLVAALEWLVSDFATRTGLSVHFETNVDYLELSADQAIALYRTAQESLTNVARHASASGVNVSVTLMDQALRMVIADDGRGITADEIGRPGSLGLVGMRERIFSVAGELTIEGVPGHGTSINVRVPLSSASE